MTPSFTPIETPRLRLRLAEVEDAAAVVPLMTPAVSRWLAAYPVPCTHEMVATRLGKALAAYAEGRALPLAIVRKEDGRFMGLFESGLVAPDLAWFGYWLGEAFHGARYVREAAPAALAATFKALGVAAIEAGCQPENKGSVAVMEACGMTYVGQRMVHASARNREELCLYYRLERGPR